MTNLSQFLATLADHFADSAAACPQRHVEYMEKATACREWSKRVEGKVFVKPMVRKSGVGDEKLAWLRPALSNFAGEGDTDEVALASLQHLLDGEGE